MYPKVKIVIAGEWTEGSSGKAEKVLNPATGLPIGDTPHASRHDLDRALEAAKTGFETWRRLWAQPRSKRMRKAADIIRSRVTDIAQIMTLEQGKPIIESTGEATLA